MRSENIIRSKSALHQHNTHSNYRRFSHLSHHNYRRSPDKFLTGYIHVLFLSIYRQQEIVTTTYKRSSVHMYDFSLNILIVFYHEIDLLSVQMLTELLLVRSKGQRLSYRDFYHLWFSNFSYLQSQSHPNLASSYMNQPIPIVK